MAQKRLTWQLITRPNGEPAVKPRVTSEQFDDPFFGHIANLFWPFAWMTEISDTALLAAIESGQVETVTDQPDNGLGIVSATATPLGGGLFEVVYEVKDE